MHITVIIAHTVNADDTLEGLSLVFNIEFTLFIIVSITHLLGKDCSRKLTN